MKKYLLFALAAGMVLASCTKESIDKIKKQDVAGEAEISFVADTDNSNDTKTSLESDGKVNWVANDKVMIFGEDASHSEKIIGYTVASAGATAALNYSDDIKGSGAFTVSETPRYALYPMDATATVDNSGNIKFTLPQTQNYAANSFGNGSNVAVGTVSNTAGIANIQFKNVCGYLRLKLSSESSITVSKIVLSTKGTEKIWGTFSADATGEAPVAVKTADEDGGTSITLDCGTGVALSTSETAFYFVVPVGAFADGFTAEVWNNHGKVVKVLSSTGAKTIERKKVKAIKNQEVAWLPAGYTEAAYIVSNGTNCINTGVQVSAKGYRMECAIQITAFDLSRMLNTNNPSLFGAAFDQWSTKFFFTSFDIKTSGGDNTLRLLYNSYYSKDAAYGKGPYGVYEEDSPFVLNQDYHIDVNLIRNQQSLTINGVSYTTHKFDEDVNESCRNYTVAFLGNHIGNATTGTKGEYQTFYPARTYFCNMYDGNNQLVRQLIPAYNGSAYGFYDLVGGGWYTNVRSAGSAFGGGNL